jgi:hypothetical protein
MTVFVGKDKISGAIGHRMKTALQNFIPDCDPSCLERLSKRYVVLSEVVSLFFLIPIDGIVNP